MEARRSAPAQNDPQWKLLVSPPMLAQTVGQMALGLDVKDTVDGNPPLFIGILTGAFMFLADLVRQVQGDVQIGWFDVSSYSGTTPDTNPLSIDHLILDRGCTLTGRDIFLVDGICDSGRTMEVAIEHCKKMGAGRVRTIALLARRDTVYPFVLDYVGFRVPNNFVIGYGMDFNGMNRDLYGILYKDEEEPQEQADAPSPIILN